MSSSKHISENSSNKLVPKANSNLAKNVELSDIHKRNTQQSLSSNDNYKDLSHPQIENLVGVVPNLINTQSRHDTKMSEENYSSPGNLQFSLENEVITTNTLKKNYIDKNGSTFTEKNYSDKEKVSSDVFLPYITQNELLQDRASADTHIDIPVAGTPWLPELAQDDAASSKPIQTSKKQSKSRISTTGLTEEGYRHISKDAEDSLNMTDINISSRGDEKYNHTSTSSIDNEAGLRPTKRTKSNPYPIELKKTGAAIIFMVLNFCATTISLALTHERTPIKDPLPDFLLDNVIHKSWGLTASEIVLQINVISAMIVLILHKHRFIILRRLALILGLLYGYRAVTMFVTNLPKADPTYFCLAKAEDGITLYEVLSRAFSILSGFGLSMNGKHVYCGDYIYSGHTMTIILAHLLIQEYTSKRLWLLHWLTFILAIFGVAFLVVGRGHYTIDIIVAYWLTTRLWWIYHSMASLDALQSSSVNNNGAIMNHFVRIWWWPLFRWFECNVRSGPLPNGFDLPFPAVCLKVCIRIKKSRARSKQIFSGAPTTDTAINAANYLVNNLSNLTSNINGSGKNDNSRRARSSRTATSKAGIKDNIFQSAIY